MQGPPGSTVCLLPLGMPAPFLPFSQHSSSSIPFFAHEKAEPWALGFPCVSCSGFTKTFACEGNSERHPEPDTVARIHPRAHKGTRTSMWCAIKLHVGVADLREGRHFLAARLGLDILTLAVPEPVLLAASPSPPAESPRGASK